MLSLLIIEQLIRYVYAFGNGNKTLKMQILLVKHIISQPKFFCSKIKLSEIGKTRVKPEKTEID